MLVMESEHLTERARELFDALKVTGAWMSRAELARATGKNRLSPHDVMLLARLVDNNMVEMRQRESNTPIGTAFDYRAKPEVSNG